MARASRRTRSQAASEPEQEPGALESARAKDRPRTHQGTSEAEQQTFAATERLLATIDLNDLSVAQIIAEAEISRATFYFYFSSKYAVITGLLARVLDEIYQTVQPFIGRERDESTEAALQKSLLAATDVWGEHRLILRAAHEHWRAVPELRSLWLGVFEGFAESLTEELERERKAGLLVPLPPTKTMASTLLWATEGCLYMSGLGLDPHMPGENKMVEPLLALWAGALYGHPRDG